MNIEDISKKKQTQRYKDTENLKKTLCFCDSVLNLKILIFDTFPIRYLFLQHCVYLINERSKFFFVI